jgi:hypothetical protein
MKVKVTSEADLTPESLAAALIEAGPEGFARFWFCFDEQAEKSKISVSDYGSAMDDPQGRRRMVAFDTIYHAAKVSCYERNKPAKVF